MSTRVEYNGITFESVLTEMIDQRAVRDSTGVDPIYVETTIVFQSYIVAGYGSVAIGHGALDLPTGILEAQQRLAQPRRRFRMWIGDDLVFDIAPSAERPGMRQVVAGPGTLMDVNHGPTLEVRVGEVVDDQSLKVRVTVKFATLRADRPGATYHGISKLRYWISEQIDREWLTTRTYTGRVRVDSMDRSPHLLLRNVLTLPPLQAGFQRQSISINESPNGLEAEFTVQDREVHMAAPRPAVQWEGSHTIRSAGAEGAVAVSDCNVSLSGAKYVTKRALFNLACRIVDQRISLLERFRQQPRRTFIEVLDFRDQFTGNRVEVAARIKHIDNGPTLFNTLSTDLAKPVVLPAYDRDRSWARSPTATLSGIVRQALQDCLHPAIGFPVSPVYGQQYQTPQGAANEQAPRNYYDEPALPWLQQPDYSIEQYEAPYLEWRSKQRFLMKTGRTISPNQEAYLAHQTHGKFVVGYYMIQAQRLEKWPVMPDPESLEGFGDHELIPETPQRSKDGLSTLYAVRARFSVAWKKADGSPANSYVGLPIGRDARRDQPVYKIPATMFADQGAPGSPL